LFCGFFGTGGGNRGFMSRSLGCGELVCNQAGTLLAALAMAPGIVKARVSTVRSLRDGSI